MKPLTAEWLQKAEEDFAAACHLQRRRRPALPSIVCFHCQQCAEKHLKAQLVEAGVDFPKIHNLTALLRLAAPAVPSLGHLHPTLAALNPYAAEYRYPGDGATLDEARAALANCRLVRRAVRKCLGLDEPPSAQMKLQIREKRARYRKKKRK